MAAAAGIFSHAMTAGQALTGGSSAAGATSEADATDTSSTSSSSATISANDFLTLLVTEMKNQDPTATTDPNEYINQLVNVNSLEQLISINQELSDALGTSSGASATPVSGQATTGTSATAGASAASRTAGTAAGKGSALAGIQSFTSGAGAASNSSMLATTKKASGNLSVPDAKASSHTVARALDGRSQKASISNNLSIAR